MSPDGWAVRYKIYRNLGGFPPQLQASYMFGQTKMLWYNETDCRWMTIFIYIYIYIYIYIFSSTDRLFRCDIYIYIYIYIYIFPWYKPLIAPRYGSNCTTNVIVQEWIWHYIIHEGWYTIKQRKQNKLLIVSPWLCGLYIGMWFFMRVC